MQLAKPLESPAEHSPLASARLQRGLTLEKAAEHADLSVDEVTWLEQGRVYRFRSSDDAMVSLLLYATALGIDHREARRLAGLPVLPRVLASPTGRLVGAAAIAALLTALVMTVLLPGLGSGGATKTITAASEPALPPAWKIDVDVFNGSGDINYTRQVASRIGALGYHIRRVTKAKRFDYPDTAVYYEPGGEAVAARLARQLGVQIQPLPGGSDSRRLVVIVGPHRGPG